MKTKLLKKVRKRFEIIYYPNGKNPQDKTPCIGFIDKYNPFNNETKCIGEYTHEDYIIDKYKKKGIDKSPKLIFTPRVTVC